MAKGPEPSCVCGTCRRCKNRIQAQRWRANHPAASRARSSRHKAKNLERYRAYARGYAKDYRALHPEETKEANRLWALNNRARIVWNTAKRNARLKGYAMINMPFEAFRAWYEEQVALANGRCQWCGAPFTEREPHMDHDHETGQPRALTCKRCNTIEGYALSPEHLECIAQAMRSFQRKEKAA